MFREFDNLNVTEVQYQKLVARFGEAEAQVRLERLHLQKHVHGYKYKSDYHAVLAWGRTDERRRPAPVEPTAPDPGYFEQKVTGIHRMFERDYANGLRQDIPTPDQIRQMLRENP